MKYHLDRVAASFAIALVLSGGLAACQPSFEPYAKYELSPSKQGRLTARFFGVSTILIDDGTTAIMTDGFFSRPSIGRQLASVIWPNQKRIDDALRDGEVPSLVAALMVCHSHYDHALDSATVALQRRSLLIGSESTANLARAEGFPEQNIHVMKAKETIQVGAFRITVFKSCHSEGGAEDLLTGDITNKVRLPARVWEYREGGTYSFLVENAGFRILIHPGANAVPNMYDGVPVDVVFLATATLGTNGYAHAKWYWDQVVMATGAKLVIPIHWDDFFVPLDGSLKPARLMPGDFAKGMTMLMQLANDDQVPVRFMPAVRAGRHRVCSRNGDQDAKTPIADSRA
jgi:L-ascorbate metabolism protein UlaG (beta-lactamase superfamily)